MNRKIYRLPEETARHRQMKTLCLNYFTAFDNLIRHPSALYAFRARKACTVLKKVVHERGLELLELYSVKRNEGRKAIFPIKYRKHKTNNLSTNEKNN